jgi:hypothetical protein
LLDENFGQSRAQVARALQRHLRHVHVITFNQDHVNSNRASIIEKSTTYYIHRVQ